MLASVSVPASGVKLIQHSVFWSANVAAKLTSPHNIYQRTTTFTQAHCRLTFRFMAGISIVFVVPTMLEFLQATWKSTGFHFLHKLLSKTPPANMNHVTRAWLLTMWLPSSSPCPYSDPQSHKERKTKKKLKYHVSGMQSHRVEKVYLLFVYCLPIWFFEFLKNQ